MNSNIVHQYFKKEIEGSKILVKVDPIYFKGQEIQVLPSGEMEINEREFDDQIFDDLKHDGFETSSPLEFNLYLNGLA